MPNDFRETYEGGIKTIFDKQELNEKTKFIINVIQTKMKQNKLTDEGQRAQKENCNKIIL